MAACGQLQHYSQSPWPHSFAGIISVERKNGCGTERSPETVLYTGRQSSGFVNCAINCLMWKLKCPVNDSDWKGCQSGKQGRNEYFLWELDVYRPRMWWEKNLMHHTDSALILPPIKGLLVLSDVRILPCIFY